MTCGVARLPQDLFRVNLAFCCECGSGDLEGVLHLESPGAASVPNVRPVKVECGVAEEHVAIADRRAACRLRRRHE